VNSHATSNAYGGYDALHRIDEIRRAKKATEVMTATTSPPTLHDFTIYFSLRNSSLSKSPSTMRSKT
jgi:hypothetical protein